MYERTRSQSVVRYFTGCRGCPGLEARNGGMDRKLADKLAYTLGGILDVVHIQLVQEHKRLAVHSPAGHSDPVVHNPER